MSYESMPVDQDHTHVFPVPMRTRIAPTPSGFLHAGNILNFLIVQLLAEQTNGSIRLRIDDLDSLRVRRDYLEDIFEQVRKLDLNIDQGPEHIEEHLRDFSQRSRVGRYHELIDQLKTRGHLFACTCSRQQIRDKSTDGLYPGTCRDKGLPLDTPNASLRLRLDPVVIAIPEYKGTLHVDLGKEMRDPIMRRRDGLPAYQIASLADDVDHGINCIVRGKDLLSSTAIQLHLAGLLELNTFQHVVFLHHELLQSEAGEKLSKSNLGATGPAGYDLVALRKKAAEILKEI